MKKIFTLLLGVVAMMAVSCGSKSTDNQAEGVDTAAIQEKLESEEIAKMMDIINGVSGCLDSISMQEKIIFDKKEGTPKKEQLMAQLKGFQELLARKQSQINALMAKNADLNSSSKKTIQNLQKMVEFLNQQIAEKNEQIEALEKQLSEKNVKIEELNLNVTQLTSESESLKEQNSQQDKQLNKVYYIIGTSKELKAAGLLKGGLLSKKKVNAEGVDNSKFKSTDKRSLNTIVIKSKSPKVVSSNPASSYTLEKNADGTTTLHITNVDKFWSVSPYLIIQE